MPLLGDEYKDKVPANLLRSYKEEKLEKKTSRKNLKAELSEGLLKEKSKKTETQK